MQIPMWTASIGSFLFVLAFILYFYPINRRACIRILWFGIDQYSGWIKPWVFMFLNGSAANTFAEEQATIGYYPSLDISLF